MAPSCLAHANPQSRQNPVADLVLGPLLRHVGPTDATVWVETDAHCEVAKGRLYQAVCSPLRNALPSKKSYRQSHAWSKPATLAARLLARLAWRPTHNATFFDNQVATLEFEARRATITFENAVLDASKKPALEKLYQYRLA
jgi:hypothetical protein